MNAPPPPHCWLLTWNPCYGHMSRVQPPQRVVEGNKITVTKTQTTSGEDGRRSSNCLVVSSGKPGVHFLHVGADPVTRGERDTAFSPRINDRLFASGGKVTGRFSERTPHQQTKNNNNKSLMKRCPRVLSTLPQFKRAETHGARLDFYRHPYAPAAATFHRSILTFFLLPGP